MSPSIGQAAAMPRSEVLSSARASRTCIAGRTTVPSSWSSRIHSADRDAPLDDGSVARDHPLTEHAVFDDKARHRAGTSVHPTKLRKQRRAPGRAVRTTSANSSSIAAGASHSQMFDSAKPDVLPSGKDLRYSVTEPSTSVNVSLAFEIARLPASVR